MENENKIYSVSEAAKIFKISRSGMHGWIKQGFIKAEKDTAGNYYFTQDEINNAITAFHIDEKCYDCKQAAKMLGISRPQTVGKYCAEGKIKTYTLPNGNFVIPHEEITEIKKMLKYAKRTCILSSVLNNREEMENNGNNE